MTTLHIAGVKSFVKGKVTYYYFRKTGERITDPVTNKPIDPTVDLVAFTTRLAELRSAVPAQAASPAKAATLEDLIVRWCGRPEKPKLGWTKVEPSLDWLRLKPATRRSYWRVIDPEDGHLRRALKKPLSRVPLHLIRTPFVAGLQDKVAKLAGFWFGNYTVKVLRPMFKWGKLHGHMEGENPAKDIPMLERPEDLPDQHRGWAQYEYRAMLEGALDRGWDGIAMAFALARWAGWATGDICNQPPAVWQDPRIAFVRRKTRKGKRVTDMLAPLPLLEIMRELDPDPDAPALVTNEQGDAYTEDGLRSMVWRLCTDLVEEGKVKPGLTIHGLRHSLGKQLYDLGIEKESRKAVMSHKSDQAAAVYERDGNRSAKADAGIVQLNRHLRRKGKRT